MNINQCSVGFTMHLKTLLQKQHIFIYLFSICCFFVLFFVLFCFFGFFLVFFILIFMVLLSKMLLINYVLLSKIVLTDFTFRPEGLDIIFRQLSCLNISSVTSSSDLKSKKRKKGTSSLLDLRWKQLRSTWNQNLTIESRKWKILQFWYSYMQIMIKQFWLFVIINKTEFWTASVLI